MITENIRMAETADHTIQSGQQRISELKKDKYTCLRQSQIRTICTKNTGPVETRADIKEAVAKKLKNFTLEFNQPESEPQSYQDVADSHRWNVFTATRLGAKTVNFYQFVHYYETGKQVLAFPVSEDQPVGNLVWKDGQLGMTLVLSEKVDNQTHGYVLTAYYSN